MKKFKLLIFILITISGFECNHRANTVDKKSYIYALSETEILQLYHLTERAIEYFAFDTLSYEKKSNLGKEIDPILNDSLKDVPRGNPVFDGLKNCIEYARSRKSESRKALKNGDLASWLSPKHKKSFDNNSARLNSFYLAGQNVKPEGEIYINILYVLDYMMPVLDELLDHPGINDHLIFEKYLEVGKQDRLLNTIVPLLEEDNYYKALSLFFFESEYVKLKKLNNLYQQKETFSFPGQTISRHDSLKIMAAYAESYYKKSHSIIKLRKELLTKCESLANSVIHFNRNYLQGKAALSTTRNCFSDILAVKRYNDRSVEDRSADVVDVGMPSQNYFVRLTFKEGTFERLYIDKDISNTEALVSIVYWVHTGTGSRKINITKKDSAWGGINGNVDSIYSQIPLGLIIKGIKLTIGDTLSKAPTYSTYHLNNPLKFTINLPDKGIWNQYQYNESMTRTASEVLQLSKALGISLQKVTLDSTWDLKLSFTWKPQSFIKELQRKHPELSSLEVSLNDLRSTDKTEFRHNLQKLVVENIKNKIVSIYSKHKDELHSFFKAGSLGELRLDSTNSDGFIGGTVELNQVRFEAFNIQISNILLKFKLNYTNGETVFGLSNISLNQYLDTVRTYLHTAVVEKVAELSMEIDRKFEGVIVKNVTSLLNISSFGYNLSDANFYLKSGDKTYRFQSKKEFITQLKSLASAYISGNTKDIEKWIKDYSKNIVVDKVKNLIQNECHRLRGTSFPFFGIDFKIDSVTCSEHNVIFTASSGSATIKCERKEGKIIVIDYDVSKIVSLVKEKTRALMQFGEQLYIADTRMVLDQIIIDIGFRIESLNFDEIVASIGIGKDQSVNATFLTSSLNNLANQSLSALFATKKVPVAFGKFAGLEIEFRSFSIIERQLIFKATANFYLDIEIECQLILNYSSGEIQCRVTKNYKDYIAKILSDNFLRGIVEKVSPIEVVSVDIPSFRISCIAKIKVWDVIQLPDMNLTVCRDKVDIDLRPSFRLPVVIPIIPPIVSLVDPTVELKLDKKTITFGCFFSGGVNEDVRVFAKLIRVDADLNLYYGGDRLGDIDFNGKLILLSFLETAKSRGEISIKRRQASISQGTHGFLEKILKFETKTEFTALDSISFYLSTEGQVDILGIASANLKVKVSIKNSKLYIDGQGQVKIPIAELKGKVSTSLSLKTPFPINSDSYVDISGLLKIGGFTLADFGVKANIKGVTVSFEFLSIRLGARFPGINAITEGEILKMVLRVLASFYKAPAAILAFLTDPFNTPITLGVPFGTGGNENDGTSDNTNGNKNDAVEESGSDDNEDESGETEKSFAQLSKEQAGRMAQIERSSVKQGRKSSLGFEKGEGKKEHKNEFEKSDISPIQNNEYDLVFDSGDSLYGYTVMPYKSLSTRDNVYIEDIRLTEKAQQLQECIPLIQSMYCLVYKGKGYWNILGFINNNDIEKFMNLMILTPQDYSDEELLQFSRKEGNVPYYYLEYSQERIGLTFTQHPQICFIIGYSEKEIKAFTVALVRNVNSFFANCSVDNVSMNDLYKSKQEFSEFSLSLYPLNEAARSDTDGRSEEGGTVSPKPDQQFKIENSFRIRESGLFSLGKKNLVEETSGDNFKSLYSELKDEESRLAEKVSPGRDRAYIIRSGNELYAFVGGPEEKIDLPSAKYDFVKDFIDLTSKISFPLNSDTTLKLLSNCTQVQTDIVSYMNSVRSLKAINRLSIINFIQYLNIRAGSFASEFRLCNTFKIPQTNILITPNLRRQNKWWNHSIVLQYKDEIMHHEMNSADLFQDLGIKEEELNQQTLLSNKLLSTYLASLVQDLNNYSYSEFLFQVLKDRRIVWLTEDLSKMTILNDGTPGCEIQKSRIHFIENELFDNSDQRGDFFNYPAIVKKNKMFFDRMIEPIFLDTSTSVCFGLVKNEKNNLQLAAFIQGAKTIKLYVKELEGEAKEFSLEVPRHIFDSNLTNIKSVADIKKVKLNKARVRIPGINDKIEIKAQYIFSGLGDVSDWNSSRDTEINPLSLFNKNLILNIY